MGLLLAYYIPVPTKEVPLLRGRFDCTSFMCYYMVLHDHIKGKEDAVQSSFAVSSLSYPTTK